MAETKTRPTGASVEDYLAARGSAQQRDDCRELITLLSSATRQPPRMWGPSIVGFGRYRYKYDSGHEGESARMAFSPRAKELVVYIMPGFEPFPELMARLGKYRTGKSCLYIKRLADVDEEALEALAGASLEHMRRKYPD